MLLLDKLDLVIIRVLDKGDDRGAALHRSRLTHHIAATPSALVTGGIDIIDLDGDMAKGIAQIIMLDTPIIGQLDHRLLGFFAKTDKGQRELALRIILAPQHTHTQYPGIICDGALQVSDTD